MSPYVMSLVVRIFLTFAVLQLIAVGGCYVIWRPIRHKRRWTALLACLLALNSGWFFMFAPLSCPAPVRAALDYLLLYPFFIYLLVCVVLGYFFVGAGICFIVRRLLRLCAAVLRALRDMPAPESNGPDTGRRAIVKAFAAGIVYPVGGLSAYGMYVGSEQFEVSQYRLHLRGFPQQLEGLSIVQLSDLHAGPFMDAGRIEHFVHMVNGLSPDMIVITGDVINGGDEFTQQTAGALADLQAPLGVFGVMGNHDFYGTPDMLCDCLGAAGVQMLRNRWCAVHVPGSRTALYLAGIDDPRGSWYVNNSFSALDGALQGMPPGACVVLLSHRPNIFRESARRGIQLTLAGHTHGGQVIIPNPLGRGISLARMAYEHDYGLYKHDNSYMYVNRGLGVVGPPVRINCPREITRFTLFRDHQPPRSGHSWS